MVSALLCINKGLEFFNGENSLAFPDDNNHLVKNCKNNFLPIGWQGHQPVAFPSTSYNHFSFSCYFLSYLPPNDIFCSRIYIYAILICTITTTLYATRCPQGFCHLWYFRGQHVCLLHALVRRFGGEMDLFWESG